MKEEKTGRVRRDLRNNGHHIVLITAGIVLNVLLAFVSDRFKLPLFFDTIGTVCVSVFAGFFPGIVTAVLSNTICVLFNEYALYYAFVNALIAIATVYFRKKGAFDRIKTLVIYIMTISLGCGVVSACVQWEILGHAQSMSVDEIARSVASTTHISFFLSFLIVNVLLNIVDKGISVALAALLYKIIPKDITRKLNEADWRQRPLTNDELRSMRAWNRDIQSSVWMRMVVTLITVVFAAVIIMGGIALKLFFDHEKTVKTKNANEAVRFVASQLDTSAIDDYLRLGRDAKGYVEKDRLLTHIRDNADGVEFLYVLTIEQDGCHMVFDVDTEEEPGYEPGEVVPFDEEFEPYLPQLFAGEEIEPIESDGIFGWLLTVYYPVRNIKGDTVCYVGADVSMKYLAEEMRTFVVRVLLILLGFFILILSYGLWMTGIFTVYPIGSMALCVDGFSKAGDDQKKLDENVKKIRSLDIHTNDEIEKLYNAICDLALNQAEQMRAIRYYADETAKMQDGLIITMADMVENRDSDTGAHIQKTAAYVKVIAEGLKKKGYYAEKVTPKFISDVVRSAPLHDVGKITIPDEVLNKPGKLTDEEYKIMKTHAQAGKNILEKAINTIHGESYLKEARNMAGYHHERWDGKGYPEGLHGEVIPLSARIMAVADVFDALTSRRIYKPAFSIDKALEIINEGSGTQFDPKCVEVFMDSLTEVKVILKKYNQE